MCKALRDADPSGYQAYCIATGLDPNNIEAVAQHALENNQIWVQSSNLEGWSQHIGGGLREVSEQVLVGSHLEPYQVFDHWNFIPQDPIVIPGEWIDVPYEVITLKQIVGRTLDGEIIGAAGTGVDALHEVARPTDKALRGNHEEVNPDFGSISPIHHHNTQ